MKFTGERFIPSEQGRIRLEHIHRYAMTLNFVKGRDVLDLACGEGYGSSMLAEVARSVTGVDISRDAVSHAASKYQKENLTFCEGSASRLDFDDAAFDVVVSFETLEHLAQQEEMIDEIRRVLRSDGFLVISSPNRPVYSEESGEHNEFHVKELDFTELDQLLRPRFPAIRYFGQRLVMGTVMQPLGQASPSLVTWNDDGISLTPGVAPIQAPVYFLAVCGKVEADLPAIEASLLLPHKLDLVKHYTGFARWAQSLDVIVQERENRIAKLEHIISARIARIETPNSIVTYAAGQASSAEAQGHVHFEREVGPPEFSSAEPLSVDRARSAMDSGTAHLPQLPGSHTNEGNPDRDWALILQSELSQSNAQLTALMQSNSWRMTSPLREARRWVDTPRLQLRRYSLALLRRAKRAYQSLPLSPDTKAAHRRALATLIPRVLLATSAQSSVGAPSSAITVTTDPIRPEDVVLAVSDMPRVSVIIPVFGKVDYTLRCLRSIGATSPKVAFEVIVVDDHSPDDSVDVIKKIAGVRLLTNKSNLGFIRACNTGALASRGEYLLFLNNDTEVQPNWMDELLRTFHEFPGTGLVGSKLLYPDGRLQEAGGIIWRDGSAWNFGRFQGAAAPVYNYAREVDYCSGASVMVPKALFQELGGFDEHYVPAYCEDADLALKIRQRGYRVIYQPLSSVVHFEGVTSGTDTSSGPKAYQVANTAKLFKRWHEYLQQHQIPGAEVDKAKDRGARFRALVIDHCTPTPNQDAGSVTVFNMLLLLREMGFQVTFIPEDNFLYLPGYTEALQRAGIEVLYAPQFLSVDSHVKECGARYDLALLFRPVVVERHLKSIRKHCPRAKVLFHTVDLHFLRMAREAELQADPAKLAAADDMKKREFAALKMVDASIVHSTAELELLRPLLPAATIHQFPLILDVKESSPPFAARNGIVFVGGYHHAPNVDAVRYFVSEVMPLLRRQLPGVCFYVAGSNPPPAIEALACEDVVIAGFVQDLDSLFDSMRVSVAPLRYGAGIKGKIGTAMAAGLPTVGTTLAVEGMSLIEGEHILVADDSEAFASAIVRLHSDEGLWGRISEHGRAFAKEAWGSEAAWRIFSDILLALDFKPRSRTHELRLYSEYKCAAAKCGEPPSCRPIASVSSRDEFECVLAGDAIRKISELESRLLEAVNAEVFTVPGYCMPCDQHVPLMVDMKSGGRRFKHGWVPNWRERLECPQCGMNNRQRLMASLVKEVLSIRPGQHVYLMEQVTPIYAWASRSFPRHRVFGSEYLGHEYDGGAVIRGIRHENVESLSFADDSLDLIVSNDVFEHVPNPVKAFSECARVLKPGGVMLATIPFHSASDSSVVRARYDKGSLEHLVPPEYHGNPVSAEGSIVFTDFGWDLIDWLKIAGFSSVAVDVHASAELGHLGGGQIVFRLSVA